MKLEHQVASLELCRRLKELGVRQDSHFAWIHDTEKIHKSFDGEVTEYVEEYSENCFLGNRDNALWNGNPMYSAFTVAELGEMLPVSIKSWKFDYRDDDGNEYLAWTCRDTHNHHEQAHTEADARSLMLIYLLENRLITLSDVGEGDSARK